METTVVEDRQQLRPWTLTLREIVRSNRVRLDHPALVIAEAGIDPPARGNLGWIDPFDDVRRGLRRECCLGRPSRASLSLTVQ